MAMVDADGSCHFRWTRSPSRLAWSEGRRPPRRLVCTHQMNRVNNLNGFAICQLTVSLALVGA